MKNKFKVEVRQNVKPPSLFLDFELIVANKKTGICFSSVASLYKREKLSDVQIKVVRNVIGKLIEGMDNYGNKKRTN